MHAMGVKFLTTRFVRFAALCCAALLVALPRPAAQGDVPPTCWTFLPPQIACPGCADVFNCGNCALGSCNTVQYQVCAKTYPAFQTEHGYTMTTSTVKCFTKYRCGIPNPCAGPCTASGVWNGDSGVSVIIQEPGIPC